MNQVKKINAPIAETKDYPMEIHGDQRNDLYYWMRLSDEQKNAETPDEHTKKVVQYLEAENEYKEKSLSEVKEFRNELFEEIKGRIKPDDSSVPYFKNGYFYLTEFEKGKEYPIYRRKKGSLDANAELLIDVNTLAEGKSYYNIGALKVSPDNQWLAYAEDTVSRRVYSIKFKNIATGEILGYEIPGAATSIEWSNDSKSIVYVLKDEQTLLPFQVKKHTLKQPKKDVTIYTEKDNTFYTYVYKTTSKKHIIIALSQTVSNEYLILDANAPAEPKMFLPRERNHEHSLDHFGNEFYVKTNHNATNFKLITCPDNEPFTKDNWVDKVPHRKDVLFEGFDLFDKHLITEERIKGITNLRVMKHDGSDDHYIDFAEEAYLAYSSTNADPSLPYLRVGFTSMTVPNTIYDYDFETKKLTVKKQQEVVGGYDASLYESKRFYATSRDGVEIPISLVYKKDTPPSVNTPLLQYAYGSYGSSMDPYFSSVRLSLLNRGVAFAIAHIRGGMEMGKHWYEDGKMLKKMNTFNDFIDCSSFLIDQKMTSSDNLFAMGGSAGGLLMGVIMNERPDLYKGVIAAVPFVDVLTTMLDESIPLTTGEFDEWGNPKEKEYYNYMKTYSPYDNIKKQDYPATLITTGFHDSQVQYWEPAKWVAKLRTHKTDKNPLLLHTEMSAGHGGASGRFEKYKEVALEYAFILDLAGKIEK